MHKSHCDGYDYEIKRQEENQVIPRTAANWSILFLNLILLKLIEIAWLSMSHSIKERL